EEAAKPGVYLDADERTNRILMIGVGEQLGLVDDLVDALDVEQQDLRSMKLYRIRHVDAEEVRTKLEELGIITRIPETMASTRITGGPRTTGQTAAAQAAAARAAAAVAASTTATGEISEEGPVEEPQVVVVESTNSLLVNATPEQHVQIETIISYVDSETLEDEIPYKVYPLENSSPDHLATVLQSLIQETTENKDAEGKVTETVTKRREDEIAIVPDPNTYSLIVYGSKKNQEWISDLIKKLDKRRPQVLIDVTLVEITESDEFHYDLNVVASDPDLGTTSSVTPPPASPDVLGETLQVASGALTAFYGDEHIQALLEAVQSKSYGRVLAKPKVLVNDNEPGMIKTTDTTYVLTTSSIPVSGGGAGQDTTLIQTAEEYTPYEAGITLDITPHISEGDLLRLDISLVRSDFIPTSGEAEKPPNTIASEVVTAVTVPDGSTIILGGLLKLNQTKGGSKVPILGDLPLIGGLFRNIDNSDRQSKLYVFVKAEIIRPVDSLTQGMEDLEQLSERNRLAFERHEQEFQDYQDWPGIKAKPVGPLKVLEAQ
ncbi:MAG: type II secretion system protein GspD, partial [Planctomycetota bacterium]